MPSTPVVVSRRQDKKGILDGKKSKQRDFEPMIIDHDTDIEWVTDFEPVAISESPGAGYTYSEIDVQPHLEIET